jgi:hypothetical protein
MRLKMRDLVRSMRQKTLGSAKLAGLLLRGRKVTL